MIFTVSDWSRAVFEFESDTDVAERRQVAQNSCFYLNFSKKNFLKKFGPKVDVWAYLGLNVKSRLNHTIWGSFESPWALENGKNNEKKICVQKWTIGHIWG